MKQILESCFINKDVYVVLADGLDLNYLFVNCLQACLNPKRILSKKRKLNKTKSENLNHSNFVNTQPIQTDKTNIFLVLNCDKYFIIFTGILKSRGFSSNDLPVLFTSDKNTKQRVRGYQKGGIFFITGRILIVDILRNNINLSNITGILIYNSHRIKENSLTELILNILRKEKSVEYFVKCFSDKVNLIFNNYKHLTNLNKLNKVMTALTLDKIIIYPRFHKLIKEELNNKLKVYKLNIKLSKRIKSIQRNINSLLASHYSEIMNSITSGNRNKNKDEGYRLNINIRKYIKSKYNNINLSYKVLNLIRDFETLQSLYRFVMNHSSLLFYLYLNKVKDMNLNNFGIPKSYWFLTEQANNIFKQAQCRVFKLSASKSIIDSKYQTDSKETKEELFVNYKGEKAEINISFEENNKVKKIVNIIKQKNHNEIVLVVSKIRIATLDNKIEEKENELYKLCKIVFKKYRIHLLLALMKNNILENEEDKTFVKEILEVNKKKDNFLKALKRRDREGEDEYRGRSIGRMRNILDNENNFDIDILLSTEQQNKINLIFKNELNVRYILIYLTQEDACLLSVENRLLLKYYFHYKRIEEKNSVINSTEPIVVDGENSVENESSKNTTKMEVLELDERVVFRSIEDCENEVVFDNIKPDVVILTEPTLTLIRQVEMYAYRYNQARDANLAGKDMKLYLLFYKDSIEQKIFEEDVIREQNNFKQLINEKARLVLVNDKQQDKFMHHFDSEYLAEEKKLKNDIILVDTREFMSSLPYFLYKVSLKMIPQQFEVGDFILTKDFCVERKALSDLISSFNSGRLVKQIQNMIKYYKYPMILLEFNTFKEWQNFNNSISFRKDYEELTNLTVREKLVCLMMIYPKISFLWTHSQLFTAKLFKHLKENNVDPVVEESLNNSSTEEENTNVELLRKFPGVTNTNISKIRKKTKNLAHLAKLSQSELKEIIGDVNGKILFDFLGYSIFAELIGNTDTNSKYDLASIDAAAVKEIIVLD